MTNPAPIDPTVQKVIDATAAVLDNPIVDAEVQKETAKIPANARGVIYEVAQWAGAAGAGAATVAAFLDGKPQLIVGTIAGVLLFLTNRLAKANLSQA
jgi:hypothetical protein